MQIVKNGTRVITNSGQIKALITGVCIRNESVSYEISYFGNGEHKNCWIYRYEFEIDSSEKKQAGFKNYTPQNIDDNVVLLSANNEPI